MKKTFIMALLCQLCSIFATAQTNDSDIVIDISNSTYQQMFDSLTSGLIHSRVPCVTPMDCLEAALKVYKN